MRLFLNELCYLLITSNSRVTLLASFRFVNGDKYNLTKILEQSVQPHLGSKLDMKL